MEQGAGPTHLGDEAGVAEEGTGKGRRRRRGPRRCWRLFYTRALRLRSVQEGDGVIMRNWNDCSTRFISYIHTRIIHNCDARLPLPRGTRESFASRYQYICIAEVTIFIRFQFVHHVDVKVRLNCTKSAIIDRTMPRLFYRIHLNWCVLGSHLGQVRRRGQSRSAGVEDTSFETAQICRFLLWISAKKDLKTKFCCFVSFDRQRCRRHKK